MDWLIGAAGALIVAGAAYRKRSLSESGAAAAILMGTIYYGAGNVFWFGTLLLFHNVYTSLPVRETAEGRLGEILCQDRPTGCRSGIRQWRHRYGAVSDKRMVPVRSVGIPVYRCYGYRNGGYLGYGVRQP